MEALLTHLIRDLLSQSNQSRAERLDLRCNFLIPKNLFEAETLQPAEEGEVLTEILSDVQQDFRGSSVQLVKERAETEEEERSHAETITTEGQSERYGRE